MDVSRRDILKGSAVLAAGLAATGAVSALGCSSTPAEEVKDFWLPEAWDYEADVVVVGYGGAGATAAITAADNGAKVIVLEKAPIEGGGSTRMSGGFVFWGSDPDGGAKHLEALSTGATPYDVCRAYMDQAMGLQQWFRDMGVELNGVRDEGSAEFPVIPHAEYIRGGNVPGMGPALWELLTGEIAKRDIQVLFDHPGQELIQNPMTKEILGVKAINQDKEVFVKASRAVALTTGGIMYNEEMKNNYIRMYPIVSYGWRYNTGDGVKMAQKVGADIWHTNFVNGRSAAYFADLEPAVAGFTNSVPRINNFIYVDRYGKRYSNEKGLPAHSAVLPLGDFDPRDCVYNRIPMYLVFDETVRSFGGICPQSGGCTLPVELGGDYAWSEDNLAEIEKGWIKKADTLEELAALLNEPNKTYEKFGVTPAVDAENLRNSVEKYNAACAAGVDEEFGTPATALLPLNNPPYYAMPQWPGCADNSAGPRRGPGGEVLDPDHNPIPRLYAAGANGSITAMLYVRSGAYVGDAVVFGQIIGKNMAAETPWDAESESTQ